MKKIIITTVMLMSLILLASCGVNNAMPDAMETDANSIETIAQTEAPGSDYGGNFDIMKYRPRFYNLPVTFADLVGREVYHTWMSARNDEEINNECIAVSFIRDFNISREDFERANEELLKIWESIEASPEESSAYELYPVDLIFTFDNERINEYFLWENSHVALVVNVQEEEDYNDAEVEINGYSDDNNEDKNQSNGNQDGEDENQDDDGNRRSAGNEQ